MQLNREANNYGFEISTEVLKVIYSDYFSKRVHNIGAIVFIESFF